MNPRLPLLASLLVLWLTACTGSNLRPGDETLRSDKSVVRLLALVEASPEQQAQVLAAYDTDAARRRQLERELLALSRERDALDPRAPDFLASSEAWIARWTQLNAERYTIQARFDRSVSLALDDRQWRDWIGFTAPRAAYGDYRDGGGAARGP